MRVLLETREDLHLLLPFIEMLHSIKFGDFQEAKRIYRENMFDVDTLFKVLEIVQEISEHQYDKITYSDKTFYRFFLRYFEIEEVLELYKYSLILKPGNAESIIYSHKFFLLVEQHEIDKTTELLDLQAKRLQS